MAIRTPSEPAEDAKETAETKESIRTLVERAVRFLKGAIRFADSSPKMATGFVDTALSDLNAVVKSLSALPEADDSDDTSMIWLRDLAVTYPDGSKWSDAYVRRLAALEHADEVLTLHRAEAVEKAKGVHGTLEPAIERELADMWCILEMCRMANHEFAETCDQRGWRFRP